MLSRGQCRIWRTSVILWSHVLDHGGDQSFTPHNNLGTLRFREGRFVEAEASYAEALRLWTEAPCWHDGLSHERLRALAIAAPTADYRNVGVIRVPDHGPL